MENNELSRIPGPDVVVSPDDKVERGNNNDLESSSGKHEKHQPNDTEIEIQQLEEILGASLNLKNIHEPLKQCCIYTVPRDLRKINEEAYTPQIISIGPFHHGKQVLIEMENQKLKYMLEFLKREGVKKGARRLKGFKRYIKEKEQIIRNHYQENSSLASRDFVTMILCDAVFIIEFFLKNAKPVEKRKFDFSLDTTYMRAAITRDLQLLENQLPYFLLKKLFEKGAFHNYTKKDYPDRGGPFLSLSHLFFFGNVPEPNNEIRQYKIRHFTDLRRRFLLMNFLPPVQKQREYVRDLPTATKLHGSGVKFKGIEGRSSGVKSKEGIEGGSSLKISCEPRFKLCQLQIPGVKFKEGIEGGSSGAKSKEGYEGGSSLKISCELVPRFKLCQLPIPCFKACELRIPCFEIDDWSECQCRNLMALELCHYPTETHICNFILLMNFLIDTEKDVDLLVDRKIIFSCLGDNNTVATLFKKLGLQITPSHSIYYDICKELKEHYDRRWNRTLTTLISVYFRDIWTGTATVAAFVLLVLTFIQTVR